MTTIELIIALEEGKLLEKDYARVYGPDMGYYEKGENVQYLFKDDYKGQKFYNCSGWGSYQSTDTSLLELIKHPEYWVISKYSVEDRPWNLGFQKQN